jgi:hypothetical protein
MNATHTAVYELADLAGRKATLCGVYVPKDEIAPPSEDATCLDCQRLLERAASGFASLLDEDGL